MRTAHTFRIGHGAKDQWRGFWFVRESTTQGTSALPQFCGVNEFPRHAVVWLPIFCCPSMLYSDWARRESFQDLCAWSSRYPFPYVAPRRLSQTVVQIAPREPVRDGLDHRSIQCFSSNFPATFSPRGIHLTSISSCFSSIRSSAWSKSRISFGSLIDQRRLNCSQTSCESVKIRAALPLFKPFRTEIKARYSATLLVRPSTRQIRRSSVPIRTHAKPDPEPSGLIPAPSM